MDLWANNISFFDDDKTQEIILNKNIRSFKWSSSWRMCI